VVVTVGSAVAVLLFSADTLVNFLPVDRCFPRSFYPYPNLIPLHAEYRYVHIVADDDGLADTPCQYEHEIQPPLSVIVISLANAVIPVALNKRLTAPLNQRRIFPRRC